MKPLKLLFGTAVLLLMSFVPQENNHEIVLYLGEEVTDQYRASLLESGFTESESGFYKSGLSLKTKEIKGKSRTADIITHVSFKDSYMKEKAYKSNPWLGLTYKMTIEECKTVLEKESRISSLEVSRDMYGLYIKCRYTAHNPLNNRGLKVFMRCNRKKKKDYYINNVNIELTER